MEKPNDTQVVMNVPREIIDAQVRAAVMACLAKDKDSLVAALVRSVIEKPAEGRYDRKTALDDMIEKQITALAMAAVKEYVEALKPDVVKAIHARLGVGMGGSKGAAAKSFAEKIVDALCKQLSVSIYISNKD